VPGGAALPGRKSDPEEAQEMETRCGFQARAARAAVLACTILLMGFLAPGRTWAGPHENGVFVPHLDASIEYTTTVATYAGQADLDECAKAVVQGNVNAEKAQVWFVVASFADSPGPVDLTGAEFGFGSFDSGSITFIAWGPSLPEVLEIPSSSGWPGPSEGVATAMVDMESGETDEVVEIYWFATYVYSALTIPLSVNPATAKATALSRRETDPIESLGALGFGQEGYNPCGIPPQPEGGCCLWGICAVLTREDCEAEGGRYLGDFTACFPNPCPEPIETSWGILKKMYE